MKKEIYITQLFPENLTHYLTDTLEEIRIRKNKPIIMSYPDKDIVTEVVYTKKEIHTLMDKITKSSIYAYFDDIVNGFITINGGHRVGLCGSAVYEDGKLSNVRDISNMNIRIAKEMKGIGEGVFAKICNSATVSNTLIISPPAMGKTTLLRDLTRLISNNMKKINVALIDERNEISATYMGESQNDVGIRTDVFCGYKKPDGIERALRSMSPNVVILDEIGGILDSEAIMRCRYSGVKVIATIHAQNTDDIKKTIDKLVCENVFDYYITLGKDSDYKRTCKIETQLEINNND